jgi:hypothetical protein
VPASHPAKKFSCSTHDPQLLNTSPPTLDPIQLQHQNTINPQHHHPFSGVPAKTFDPLPSISNNHRADTHNTHTAPSPITTLKSQRISITNTTQQPVHLCSTAHSKPKENSTVNFNMHLHHQYLTNQATTSQPASTDSKLKHERSKAIKSQKQPW